MTTRVSSLPRLVLAGVALGALAACTTPQSRIERRPELYNSLSPSQQEMVRNGSVAVGFSEEMVWLALGQPDRVTSVEGEPNRDKVWEYISYRDGRGTPLYTGLYHYWYHDPIHPYYLYYPERESFARYRVVFNDGKVVSYSRVER